MDWILVLAIATFVLLIAFLMWNKMSTKRHQETGGHTSGIGGPSDPLAGSNESIRNPDTLRASMDAATKDDTPRMGGG